MLRGETRAVRARHGTGRTSSHRGRGGVVPDARARKRLCVCTASVYLCVCTRVPGERANLGSQQRSTTTGSCIPTSAPFVLGVPRDARDVDEFLTTAARGARLVLLTDDPGPALRGVRAGRVTRWGCGHVSWTPVDAHQVVALVAGFDEGDRNVVDWLASPYDQSSPVDPPGSQRNAPGLLTIALIMLAYVTAVGPVGYWVGVRPRRPWLAWGWFPAIAIGAGLASGQGQYHRWEWFCHYGALLSIAAVALLGTVIRVRRMRD